MISPYLTTRDVAILLRFDTTDGAPDLKRAHAYMTNPRHGITLRWCGRRLLAHKDDIEASLKARVAHASAS